jgi:hypothetical protein
MFGLTERQSIQRMRDLVQQVKADMQLQDPPHYMGVHDPIAAHLGLSVKEYELPLDEGQYIPDHSLIVIDPRMTDPARRNFTFFHEVSHHLIRQDDLLYAFLHEYAPRDEDFDAALERYCNIGAAEFLIPAADVCAAIAQDGFTIRLIERLDLHYPASKPAIAIQLAQCAAHKCFIVVCAYDFIPRRGEQPSFLDDRQIPEQPCLHVVYSASSQALAKYPIGRFNVIPSDHVIVKAHAHQQFIRGKACIPFRHNHTWIVDCEALPYKGKVYAAFHASPPPGPTADLPSLFDLLGEN